MEMKFWYWPGTYSPDDAAYPETYPLVMKPGVNLHGESPDNLPVLDARQEKRVIYCKDYTGINQYPASMAEDHRRLSAGSGGYFRRRNRL